MNDIDFMRRAIHLALKAKGMTSPNPIVGAVIVKGNKVIAEGFHHRCGADHAEIVALKKAGSSAQGARLFVTLEPCYHYGRTPPCVEAVIKSGIKEVIVGMKDPNPLTNGKSIRKLHQIGIKTKVGILQKECEAMNEVFLKYIKSRMPFVVAKCAQTLDGKIATLTGDSKWITSEKTRQFSRKMRDQFDAILVGVNTVLKDNPSLNGVNKQKRLKKIILDAMLKISLQAKIFKGTAPSDCIIATTNKASSSRIKSFQQKGACVIVCPSIAGRIRLKWLFKELAKREIISILIEGGAKVIGSALKEKLVDKMHIYFAPKIVGDQKALSSVDGLNISKINKTIQLNKLNIEFTDKDIFITGYVLRNR